MKRWVQSEKMRSKKDNVRFPVQFMRTTGKRS